MRKHHQTSRRRTYGRRQHEMHERYDRAVGILAWLGDKPVQEGEAWLAKHVGRSRVRQWPDLGSAG